MELLDEAVSEAAGDSSNDADSGDTFGEAITPTWSGGCASVEDIMSCTSHPFAPNISSPYPSLPHLSRHVLQPGVCSHRVAAQRSQERTQTPWSVVEGEDRVIVDRLEETNHNYRVTAVSYGTILSFTPQLPVVRPQIDPTCPPARARHNE